MEDRKNPISILARQIDECEAKMELVQDYIERFKIKDIRIVAPILDIERCITFMAIIIDHEQGHSGVALENRHRTLREPDRRVRIIRSSATCYPAATDSWES